MKEINRCYNRGKGGRGGSWWNKGSLGSKCGSSWSIGTSSGGSVEVHEVKVHVNGVEEVRVQEYVNVNGVEKV